MNTSIPCPFCGNRICNRVIELTKDADPWRTFQVECDECKARGPIRKSDNTAIDAWRMRQ